MSKTLLYKVVLVWLGFIPLAILNGTIRNYVYQPYLNPLSAHQISTITAIALFYCWAYLLLRHDLHQWTSLKRWLIGLFWVAATVVFEFGFGHWVIGHSWEVLLADYNLPAGRIWGIFLVAVLVAPSVLFVLIEQRRKSHSDSTE